MANSALRERLFSRRRAWRTGSVYPAGCSRPLNTRSQAAWGDAIEGRRHRFVERIAGVLPVHDRRHLLHGLHHLVFVADAMMQPVGDVLGNTQRRAIFHQADIVDIRHLGATDALVDPRTT